MLVSIARLPRRSAPRPKRFDHGYPRYLYRYDPEAAAEANSTSTRTNSELKASDIVLNPRVD